jgi:hypothetical protein
MVSNQEVILKKNKTKINLKKIFIKNLIGVDL